MNFGIFSKCQLHKLSFLSVNIKMILVTSHHFIQIIRGETSSLINIVYVLNKNKYNSVNTAIQIQLFPTFDIALYLLLENISFYRNMHELLYIFKFSFIVNIF